MRSCTGPAHGDLFGRILHVTIGQLSPTKLKKLRVVHVLVSYARRSEAKDYWWWQRIGQRLPGAVIIEVE
jgi:hypothetical protein